MMQTSLCFILTDDERLAKKGARFSGAAAARLRFIAIDDKPQEGKSLEQSLEQTREQSAERGSIARKSLQETISEAATSGQNNVIFVDFDAKTFDPFEAARFLRHDDALAQTRIIGFAVAVDPHLTQRAKLHGARDVVQRFAFEKLLREMSSLLSDSTSA